MNQSPEINELAAALAEAQGELQNVEKNQEGYGYNYADLASVLSIVRPVFSKHKLAIVQMPHNVDQAVGVTTRIMHASGQWIEEELALPVQGGKNLSAAQAVGVVITYARRYMAAAFAGIAQEDTDAAPQKDSEDKPLPKRSKAQKGVRADLDKEMPIRLTEQELQDVEKAVNWFEDALGVNDDDSVELLVTEDEWVRYLSRLNQRGADFKQAVMDDAGPKVKRFVDKWEKG